MKYKFFIPSTLFRSQLSFILILFVSAEYLHQGIGKHSRYRLLVVAFLVSLLWFHCLQSLNSYAYLCLSDSYRWEKKKKQGGKGKDWLETPAQCFTGNLWQSPIPQMLVQHPSSSANGSQRL